jgi:hypothetical protein
MKLIVFWVLVTLTLAPPIYTKDEFGRPVIEKPSVIQYKRDTLSREYTNRDSAVAFIERAKLIKRQPSSGAGSQWVDTVWIEKEENK